MSDTRRIGLVAVRQEILPLLDAFQAIKKDRRGDVILYEGQRGQHMVVLAEVPPGPVSAALGAQILILHYSVDSLVSVGSAGAVHAQLSPGDLVISQCAVAHDVGVFLGSRFEPSGVMGRDERGRVGYHRVFEADSDLLSLALDAARSFEVPVYVGMVVTGSQAVCSTARKRWLCQTFQALAVEMETAAVAQVATAYRLPWVSIRAISDAAGDELVLDYKRLRVYLDDERPAWQQALGRWLYLATHPAAWWRVRRLRRGLAQASRQAAKVVDTMF